MKVKTLGKNTTKPRPAYNQPQDANKNKQRLSPSQRDAKNYKTLVRAIALDYKAKNLNPAFANKAGKAIATAITGLRQTTGRFNRTQA